MYDYELKLIDSSRMIADILVADIGNIQEKYDEMMALALRDEYPLSMRAARIVALCSFKHLNLVKPHLKSIIKILPCAKVDGLKRSFLKILAELPVYIDEEELGKLTGTAFEFLSDHKQSVAIRVFSIDILVNIGKRYPDIKFELKTILESVIPEGSAGLRAKCRKTLKTLNPI
jgi:hypothetical protein